MQSQTDFAKGLKVLHDGGVEFIIVGGVAAILHESGIIDPNETRRRPAKRF